MIAASPDTLAKLRQMKQLHAGSFIPLQKPAPAFKPDTLVDNPARAEANSAMKQAHKQLLQHGYQPSAGGTDDHALARVYVYPEVNTIKLWQQNGPDGISVLFDSKKGTAATNGISNKAMPVSKLAQHLDEVQQFFGRKEIKAGGPGSGRHKEDVPPEWQGKHVTYSLDPKDMGLAKYMHTEFKYLPIASLTHSQMYTDKDYVKKMEEKIKNGESKAIIVRPFDDKLYVADGHHHLQAMQNLGYTHAPVVIASKPTDMQAGGPGSGRHKDPLAESWNKIARAGKTAVKIAIPPNYKRLDSSNPLPSNEAKNSLCFYNALKAAKAGKDLKLMVGLTTYKGNIENGLKSAESGKKAPTSFFYHAWTVSPDGRILDPTYGSKEATSYHYFGREEPTDGPATKDRADEIMNKVIKETGTLNASSELQADATCICGHPWATHTKPTDFSCKYQGKCGCTGYSTARK